MLALSSKVANPLLSLEGEGSATGSALGHCWTNSPALSGSSVRRISMISWLVFNPCSDILNSEPPVEWSRTTSVEARVCFIRKKELILERVSLSLSNLTSSNLNFLFEVASSSSLAKFQSKTLNFSCRIVKSEFTSTKV